ncbi:unnamed protein product [Ixodes pacificus]
MHFDVQWTRALTTAALALDVNSGSMTRFVRTFEKGLSPTWEHTEQKVRAETSWW